MDEAFISQRLGRLRTQMRVSAREMSISIGQANNYISNIENGKSMPSIQGLFYICDYLKISPSDFFDEGNTNPALLNQIIEQLKLLNENCLESILVLLQEYTKKK